MIVKYYMTLNGNNLGDKPYSQIGSYIGGGSSPLIYSTKIPPPYHIK